jgi:hypothetical protein
MRRPIRFRLLAPVFLAGALLGALAGPAAAQMVTPDYALTAPTWLLPLPAWNDPELPPLLPLAGWGPVRLAGAGSASGSGLSLEAGEKWFARGALGRSIDAGTMSVGGGYRFRGGDALSMQVTRQLGQDRLGLAVRYDWERSFLRLSYEQPVRTAPGPDLRFSAGMRF